MTTGITFGASTIRGSIEQDSCRDTSAISCDNPGDQKKDCEKLVGSIPLDSFVEASVKRRSRCMMVHLYQHPRSCVIWIGGAINI